MACFRQKYQYISMPVCQALVGWVSVCQLFHCTAQSNSGLSTCESRWGSSLPSTSLLIYPPFGKYFGKPRWWLHFALLLNAMDHTWSVHNAISKRKGGGELRVKEVSLSLSLSLTHTHTQRQGVTNVSATSCAMQMREMCIIYTGTKNQQSSSLALSDSKLVLNKVDLTNWY